MKYIYLLRKHPPYPYYNFGGRNHLEAFTIVGVYYSRAEAFNIAKEKNKRSNYLFTVKRIKVEL